MASALTEWGGIWQKCEYQIIDVPVNKKYKVSLIAPVPGSPIERYSPLRWGREDDWKEGSGKEKFQREKPDGQEWPPHEALARLNLNDEKAILDFCNTYGLLGLREIPIWKRQEPTNAPSKIEEASINSVFKGLIDISKLEDDEEGKILGEKNVDIEEIKKGLPDGLILSFEQKYFPEDIYSGWYDYPCEEDDYYLYHHCEPIELFKKAATEYKAFIRLAEKTSKGGLLGPQLAEYEKNRMLLHALRPDMQGLDGCNPYPVYNKGEWILGWSIRSLLEACYLRVTLDLTEGKGKYRRCKNNKCRRIFLARNDIHFYCSTRCRKNHTSDNIPPKVLKRELWEMKRSGLITYKQRKKAYSFIEETWEKRPTKKNKWDENEKESIPLEQFRAMLYDYLGIKNEKLPHTES